MSSVSVIEFKGPRLQGQHIFNVLVDLLTTLSETGIRILAVNLLSTALLQSKLMFSDLLPYVSDNILLHPGAQYHLFEPLSESCLMSDDNGEVTWR